MPFVGGNTAHTPNPSSPIVGGMNVTIPANVSPGDELWLFSTGMSSSTGLTISTPTGWQLVTSDDRSSDPTSRSVAIICRRVAEAGDAGSTLTVSCSGARYLSARVMAYRDETLSGTWIMNNTQVAFDAQVPAGASLAVFGWANGLGVPAADTVGLYPPEDWFQMYGASPAITAWHLNLSGPVSNPTATIAVQDQTSTGPINNAAWWVMTGTPAGLPLLLPRIRSNVSEDAGSILQATQAIAVELGINEAFEHGTSLGSGEMLDFREALTPTDTALVYHPIPTRNTEMLVTVDGETNLGRLASTIPDRIMVSGYDVPGNTNGELTAQQAIQYVLNQWSARHAWLSFEPVPDLRLLIPEALDAPDWYYAPRPTAGLITTRAIAIPQEEGSRRSMREILDEWLAIFPGIIIRQTSTGSIALVPRVGPDAQLGPVATLLWRDILDITEGDPDPRGVTNRARVTSQGWDFVSNQALTPPLWQYWTAPSGLVESVPDGENVLPAARQRLQNWDFQRFIALAEPGMVDIDITISVYGSWSRTNSSNFSFEGSAQHTVQLGPGDSIDVGVTTSPRGQTYTDRFRIHRDGNDAIYVTAPFGLRPYGESIIGRTYLGFVLEIDVTGTAWTRTNEAIIGEFGRASDTLPAVGGGDVLADSRAAYGERLAEIHSNAFQLTPEQAQDIARSYVLQNINPRVIRDVRQSEWNKYPVKFEHVGRIVSLPTGELAVVENRHYADSFAPTASVMTSSFTATVTENLIDTSTDWLYLDDGDFFMLDDGTMVEVS